ncbi:preprotein translocase subunit YajC [Zavarzinia sp.]|uniref:preprotein translocase subunit YajC n=1 Tax=Zavarzinia sp. TaxID=2027920 RepID=UPI003BB7572B|nr:preprotein translocase subunit YajC [Zavarzinia sp.]
MFISSAFAQTAGGPGAGGTDMLIQFAPMVLILVVFYFLMIRPQQKRAKEHRALLAAVRRGDTVVTNAGIIGKVAKVQEGEVLLEVAEGVRIRILKSTVAEVRTKGQPVADDEKSA